MKAPTHPQAGPGSSAGPGGPFMIVAMAVVAAAMLLGPVVAVTHSRPLLYVAVGLGLAGVVLAAWAWIQSYRRPRR